MSTTTADPPPTAPDSVTEITRAAPAPGRRRVASGDPAGKSGSLIAAWTTNREVPLECAGCGAAFVVSYKYRFVEGLAATVVRCPAAGCGRGREYYLPINAYDLLVAAPRTISPPTA